MSSPPSWTASFRKDLATWVRNENKPNRKSVREKVERKIQNECRKYGTPRVKSNLCEHELAMLNALEFPMYSADPLSDFDDDSTTYVADTRNEHSQEKWNRDFSSWIRWKKDNQNQGLPADADLSRWIVSQCVEHRKSQWNNDQIELLHACGFDFDADSFEAIELSGDDDDDDNDNASTPPQNDQKRFSSAMSTGRPKKHQRLPGAQQLNNHSTNAASKMPPTPAIAGASINGGMHQNPSFLAASQVLHQNQSSTPSKDLEQKPAAKENFQATSMNGTNAPTSTNTARLTPNGTRMSTAVPSTMNSMQSVSPSQLFLQPHSTTHGVMNHLSKGNYQNDQQSYAARAAGREQSASEDTETHSKQHPDPFASNCPSSRESRPTAAHGTETINASQQVTNMADRSHFSSSQRSLVPSRASMTGASTPTPNAIRKSATCADAPVSQVPSRQPNQSSTAPEGLDQQPAAKENFQATFTTGTSAFTNTAGTRQVSTTSTPPSSMQPWYEYCVQGMPTGPLQDNAALMAIPWSHSLSSQISDETVNAYYALVNKLVEAFRVQSDWDCHMWKGYGRAMVGQVGLRCSACRMVAFFPTQLGAQGSGGFPVAKALDTMVELHLLPRRNCALSQGCIGLKEEDRQRLVKMKCQPQSKDTFYKCYAQAFVNLNIQEHPQFVGRLFLGSPPMKSASNGVGTSHAKSAKKGTSTLNQTRSGIAEQAPQHAHMIATHPSSLMGTHEGRNRALNHASDDGSIKPQQHFPRQRIEPSQAIGSTTIPWSHSLSSLDDNPMNPYYSLVNNHVEFFQVQSDLECYEGCERIMIEQVGVRCSLCRGFARFPKRLQEPLGTRGPVAKAVDAIVKHHLIPPSARNGCKNVKEEDRECLRRLYQSDNTMNESYVKVLVNLGVEEGFDPQVGRGLFRSLPLLMRGAFNDEGTTTNHAESPKRGASTFNQEGLVIPPRHNLILHTSLMQTREEWSRPLYCSLDHGNISTMHCFLREQIEVFEVQPEHTGRLSNHPSAVPIAVGQVGFRCRHCKDYFSFPSSPEGAYFCANIIKKNHLLKTRGREKCCPAFSSNDRDHLKTLSEAPKPKPSQYPTSHPSYYANGLTKLGIQAVSQSDGERMFRFPRPSGSELSGSE